LSLTAVGVVSRRGLVNQSPNGEGRRSFRRKIPWFNRNCYRVGQDLVCMFFEKFREKVKIRQVVSQRK
jgi:hypothetical protein